MSHEQSFCFLIPKCTTDKRSIIEDLGLEFNYYHSEIWSYYLRKNWLGRKFYLFVIFENDTVQKIKIC